MKKPPHHYQEHNLEVEHNGIRHKATYTVESGIPIVCYDMATITGTPGRLLPHDEAASALLHYLFEKDSAAAAKTDATEDKLP